MAAEPQHTPAAVISTEIATATIASLKEVGDRLIELQESQALLHSTIAAKSSELLGSSSEFAQAKDILNRVPEYRAKMERIRRTMAATAAKLEKVEKASTALKGKLDERDRERAVRNASASSGFAAVAAR